MSDNEFDMGSLEEAMKNLQNAFSQGLSAMNQAGQEAAEDMNPDYRIIVDAELTANVEGRNYINNVHLEFLAELSSVLDAETGDIGALLAGLGIDLSEEESGQVAEQLGKPRVIAVLDSFEQKQLELHSSDGKIDTGINENGNMLITLEDEKLHFSFNSVVALPEIQTQKELYYAIPSQQIMEENIVLPLENRNETLSFSWEEKDKDGLKVSGQLRLEEL